MRAKFAKHARAELDAKEDMKDETESSASEENISAMGTVKIARTAKVFTLQQSCSTSFRDGHALHSLVKELREKAKDPVKDDFLILNIAQANTKCPRLANARAQPLKQLF